MLVALYQGPSPQGDVEAAFAKIQHVLQTGAAAGASVAVFPELYLPGYNQPACVRDLAQTVDGVWEERFSQLAKSAGCGLVIGWAERSGDRTFNTASVYGRAGELIARHRKLQPFGDIEKGIFSPGDAYTLFEFEGVKTAVLICYDIEFPEHVRAVASSGAELLLVPTANGSIYHKVPELLVPARALENRISIVYANYCGAENDLEYSGCSLAVGPDGFPFVTAGAGETVLIFDTGTDLLGSEDALSTQHHDLRRVSLP